MAASAAGDASPGRARSVLGIAATGIALAMVVVLIRGRIAGALFSDALRAPFEAGLKALGAAYYDLSFIAACTGVAAAIAACMAGTRPRAIVSNVFLGFCLLLFVIYLAHITIMKYLGSPFTYQWLYYSDFLGILSARELAGANLNGPLLAVAFGAAILFFLLRFALRAVFSVLARRAGAPAALGAVLVAMSGALALSYEEFSRRAFLYAQTAQPVVAFLASLHGSVSPIYVQPTLGDDSDFMPKPVGALVKDAKRNAPSVQPASAVAATGAGPMRPAGPARQASLARQASPVRNVIFFVMESVGAEYVGLYGSPYGATPNLDAQRAHALTISDAYAHAPTTNISMVSILTGSYPWTTGRFITSDHPDIRLPSISKILGRKGYEIGSFSSADYRYHKAEDFLAHHGFDLISDFRSVSCDERSDSDGPKETFSTRAFENLGGVSDGCAVAAMNGWIESVRAKPFFAMFWSNQTHHPYMTGKSERTFETKDAELNRYLNALTAGDEALGALLDQLQRLGLSDSTLVVVLGDHGEAFGRHGDRVHGSAIYEDNIRIPLVFINPQLFSGQTRDTVAGMADIVPTVLPLLGIEAKEAWQGRNLMEKGRPERTYFFTPWSGLHLGYREGDMKYIYDAVLDKLEVYDLRSDPLETRDLASEHAAERERIVSRIAGWVQYQDAFIRAAVAAKPKAGGDLSLRREQ